jgi:hypothetical protein
MLVSMLDEVVDGLTDLPDVWGEGTLFAFSGVDGSTDVLSSFVATATGATYGLRFELVTRRELRLEVAARGRVRVATGDVLGVDWPDATELVVAFAEWHTIVGVAPPTVTIVLAFEDDRPAGDLNDGTVAADDRWGDALVLRHDGLRFALAFGRTVEEANARADRGLRADIRRTAHDRLRFLRDAPRSLDPRHARLLNKCFSVMKVNTLAPEGRIARAWSTPDRVPHRDVWLWDSAFHSLAMNYLDPDLAWDFIAAVLDSQRDDGMIPMNHGAHWPGEPLTQPPLLAWAVVANDRVARRPDRLAWALPRLERANDWNRRTRDRNRNGLLEWYIEDDPNCRSGESGMDNSARFDQAVPLDAVDFSTYAALDMASIAVIADDLGDTARARQWEDAGRRTSRAIHQLLWDDERGLYYDRTMNGKLSDVTAISGLLPLLLDDIPRERVDRLVAAIDDPARFATQAPIPSVAISDPSWSTDMWRGATWINTNYLVIHGLERHGRLDIARRLRTRTIELVDHYYNSYGVVFEFYDSTNRRPPVECDRKGPTASAYDPRHKVDCIRDFHWTAALTACLILENTAVYGASRRNESR